MFVCEAPLTPDDQEARSWVSAELSRPDYQPTQPSPLSRFFTWLVDRLFQGAAHAAPASFPIAGFFIFLLCVVLVALIVIVATHPIRMRRRLRHAAVFDADSELSLVDVKEKIAQARAQGSSSCQRRNPSRHSGFNCQRGCPSSNFRTPSIFRSHQSGNFLFRSGALR